MHCRRGTAKEVYADTTHTEAGRFGSRKEVVLVFCHLFLFSQEMRSQAEGEEEKGGIDDAKSKSMKSGLQG